jgi:hypothetical protein
VRLRSRFALAAQNRTVFGEFADLRDAPRTQASRAWTSNRDWVSSIRRANAAEPAYGDTLRALFWDAHSGTLCIALDSGGPNET